MIKHIRLTALAVGLVVASAAAAQQKVDPALPDYKAGSGVSGNLTSIGSDTLNNLMTYWAEGYRKAYPNVNIQIQGAGSGTAPPAMVQGTAQFGPMSRPMRGTEIGDFEKRYGYKPTPIRGAIDALGVFVHKDNPIQCLSLQQIDAIFSSTRRGGANAAITTWGQAGLTGEWASRPIAMYGRNSASGTYGYFKDVALFGGDYSPSVREQPGSSTVIQGVAADINGIGYSGVGYGTADVKAVQIRDADGKCYVKGMTLRGEAAPFDLDRMRTAQAEARGRFAEIRRLEQKELGVVNRYLDVERLKIRKAVLRYAEGSPQALQITAASEAKIAQYPVQFAELQKRVNDIRAVDRQNRALLEEVGGRTLDTELSQIVRFYPANDLSVWNKLGIYLSRYGVFGLGFFAYTPLRDPAEGVPRHHDRHDPRHGPRCRRAPSTSVTV